MYFPPAGGGGVQRPLKFATHLPELGIETHVLAPDDPKWIHRDDELPPPTLAWVHRARYLGPKGRKPAEELHGTQGLERFGVYARLAGRRLLVPDENVSWNLTAVPAAIRIARREGIDAIVTTSPPSSVHLVGAAVKRATGIPWVADLRDGWRFESLRPRPALPALDRLDAALERLVATRADAVSAVTEPIAADLASRFAREVATITNGYDPEATDDDGTGADSAASGKSALTPGRRTLVHTGTLSYGGRPLGPLLEALQGLKASAPEAAQRLEVALVGPITDAERAQVERAGLSDTVRITGSVPRATAVALQRAADGLLVITGPGQSGVATGKLYEYLTARRPILVIGDETAAARIVEETGAGIAVGRNDPPALTAALRRLAESPEDLPSPSDEAVAHFGYPALAQEMAELVETAIARRAASRPDR